MDRRDFLIGAGAIALSENASPAPGQTVPPPHALVNAAIAAPSQHDKGPTIERQLANFASSLKYDDLSPEVVQAVKRLLIDTLACAFGAIGPSPAGIVEATFRKTFGGALVASVIGRPYPISTEGAALVNGVLVRYLDLNDVYIGKDPIHPSECIPSALACCEERSLDGRRLVESLVVGYEAQLALVDAFSFSERGFHSLSCAGYAVPLLVGKAWNMTSEQMINAMGIAGPRLFCLLAINRGPISMIKALPYGHDAMDSLFATRLAAAGFTGAPQSIAWFAANVKAKNPDGEFTLEQGKFRLTRVGLKRFPLQFELQTVAEAGVVLHEQTRGRTSEIQSISVETDPATIERTADPSRYEPKTKETADHSLPICLALALTDGDVTVDQFDKARWRASEIVALAKKVSVSVRRKLLAKNANGAGALVRITFVNGTSVEHTVEIADGDPKRPMSRAGLEHKFFQFAEPRLGGAGARTIMELIDRLEELPDVSILTKALRAA